MSVTISAHRLCSSSCPHTQFCWQRTSSVLAAAVRCNLLFSLTGPCVY
jgi:hypothetical protein